MRLRVQVGSVLLAGAFMLAAPKAAERAGRAMAIDDLIGAIRVADPQISPDGQTVVYVRTTTDLKTGKRNADIWRVTVADGPSSAKAFIEGPASDTTPRYLPDGKLVFVSSRDGAPQVYAADAQGGAVKKITSLAMGVQPPLIVSADGTRIAFVSDVYPECADEACNKKKGEEAEANPVKVHRLTRLLYRHWDEWRENVRHHVFTTDLASGTTVDRTPGDFDSPPAQQEDGAIAFSPDGRELAFASNREGGDREAFSTNHDIWTVPVTGGEAKKLTTNPASDLQPVYSLDGREIFVRAQRRPGFESDRWYLDAYNRTTGAKRTLFTSGEASVGDYVLSKDGANIYFTAPQDGHEYMFEVPAAGGMAIRIGGTGLISDVRENNGLVVFLRSSLTTTTDVFALSRPAPSTQLTRENSWLSDVAFGPPESLSASGAGGTPVQYWLIKPPNFDASKKYPVVFLIHGGPQGAWFDGWSSRWNPSLWAAQGWVVVAPNPRGSFGFGQKFVDDITLDWGGKVMTDLNAVFDAVAAMPFSDAAHMGIAGASYGGYAVNWILGHSNRFKAAVTHDGVFNLESMSLGTEELWFTDWEFGGRPWDAKARSQFAEWSPHLFASNIKTPTLIITNELDYRVPVDQGLQMFTVLRRNGVPSEALVFPDEGHWVLKALNSRAWHEAVFGWMNKYL